MAKKRITPSSAKAKSRRLQKEIAAYISNMLDIPLEKDGDIESRPMGQSGPDVILRGEAKKLFIFTGLECKNQETLSIWAAMEQAMAHGGKPIVFFKRNRSDTYVYYVGKGFF